MNRYNYIDTRGEHLHQLDGRPLIGTSRVVGVLAKPLAWYGSGKAVETFGVPEPKVLTKIKNKKATAEEKQKHYDAMTLSLKMIQGMNVDQYSTLVDSAYRAHDVYSRSRMKLGTSAHEECERFVKEHMATQGRTVQQYDPSILPFIAWTHENVKRFLWSEGHCYSEKYWLGGISDAGYETRKGDFGIIDFKNRKAAYTGDLWQCAGYAIQMEENGVFDKDGNQIYKVEQPFKEYCVFPLEAENGKPVYNFDIAGSKEAFLACLVIYKKLPQD